jgi:hypothetical protein
VKTKTRLNFFAASVLAAAAGSILMVRGMGMNSLPVIAAGLGAIVFAAVLAFLVRRAVTSRFLSPMHPPHVATKGTAEAMVNYAAKAESHEAVYGSAEVTSGTRIS